MTVQPRLAPLLSVSFLAALVLAATVASAKKHLRQSQKLHPGLRIVELAYVRNCHRHALGPLLFGVLRYVSFSLRLVGQYILQ